MSERERKILANILRHLAGLLVALSDLKRDLEDLQQAVTP